MTDTQVIHDSYPDDPYRETPYTRHLTDNTTVWAWGAFEFPTMTVFAPLGTLGERRSFVADQVHAEMLKG